MSCPSGVYPHHRRACRRLCDEHLDPERDAEVPRPYPGPVLGETGEVKVNFVREYVRFEDRPLDANEATAAEVEAGRPSRAEENYTQEQMFS